VITRDTVKIKVSDMVTLTEIATRLGVHNSAVANWRVRYSNFPEAVFRLNYRWSDVAAWLLATGRLTKDSELLKRYPPARHLDHPADDGGGPGFLQR
jgi:hypothetical protein